MILILLYIYSIPSISLLFVFDQDPLTKFLLDLIDLTYCWPRPWMDKMHKATSKKLRAKLARKQKKAKDPMVKKQVNKKTGKVQVSISQV